MDDSDELGQAKEIKEACLQYLIRREHSQQELLKKVSEKGYAKPDVLTVIEQLAEQGWQSDARFAESYARSRIHKGIGPLRIKAELQQRGVSDQPFNMAVEDIMGSWYELLQQVYHKKYADIPYADSREQLKRCRFLQQRGFTNDMIRRVMAE
ncbi:MAG: regulatory protein RecX [Methyloprofundus sp.]|nr:regulatory protein RecX [Methyloprofundus sp.]